MGILCLIALAAALCGAIAPEDLMDEDIKTGSAVPLAQWEPVK